MVDHYNLDLGKLENRAVLSRAALWGFIAVSVVEMVCAWLEFTSRVDLESGDDILTMSVGFVYLAYFFVFVAAIVMVAMWIHRAHANLFASGAGGLEFTPSWSVGWFFVPFASLFKPFQAMRELWNGSYGASDSYSGYTPPEVGRW